MPFLSPVPQSTEDTGLNTPAGAGLLYFAEQLSTVLCLASTADCW